MSHQRHRELRPCDDDVSDRVGSRPSILPKTFCLIEVVCFGWLRPRRKTEYDYS